MSFILDALKKSEAERQRQSGPTLLEVRVTAPRRRYPLWALIVGALLLVNVSVLMVFLLRKPTPAPTASAQSGPSAAAAAPASAPAVSTPVAAAAPPLQNALPPAVAPPLDLPAPATAADSSAIDSANPADEVPAVPPERAPRSLVHADPSQYSSLPSSTDVGNLPDLRLDLHVYTDRASDRYALINMHKVREGDTLPEGPRVLAITHEGVALNFRGQDFMLRPQ